MVKDKVESLFENFVIEIDSSENAQFVCLNIFGLNICKHTVLAGLGNSGIELYDLPSFSLNWLKSIKPENYFLLLFSMRQELFKASYCVYKSLF